MIMVCPCCGRAHKPPSCTLCTPQKSIESNRAACTKWRKKNRAHIRAREKERRVSKTSGKREAGIRAWQDANRDKMRAYSRAYRARNLDKVRAAGRKYEAERRAKRALEAAAQAGPAKPSAAVVRLLEKAERLAKICDIEAKYGVVRVSRQEVR